jgi:hypothetical protein
MRLVFDLRISEYWAEKHLGSDVGKPLIHTPGMPTSTRQVILDAIDPLVEEIKQKVLSSEHRGESLFCFVNLDYLYEKDELALASLLRLRPTVLVRTYSERHGTVYDDSSACSKCGAGRIQRSVLVLDPCYLKKKKKDFLVTITADEWIISSKLASLLRERRIQDCSFEPIHDLRGNEIDDWFQLKVHTVFGSAVPPTKFGLDYFHQEDTKGEYVCPEHCLSGLNLLSELYVKPENENDLFPALSITKNRVGRKARWIVPAPFLLISRGLADAVLENNIRGFDLEVAHVVKRLVQNM